VPSGQGCERGGGEEVLTFKVDVKGISFQTRKEWNIKINEAAVIRLVW